MIGALSFTYSYNKQDIDSFNLCFENGEGIQGKSILNLLAALDQEKKYIIFVKDLSIFYVLSRNFICYDDGKGALNKDRDARYFYLKTQNITFEDWDSLLPPRGEVENPKDFLVYYKFIKNRYGKSTYGDEYGLAYLVKKWYWNRYYLGKEKDFREKLLPSCDEYEMYNSIRKGGYYWVNPAYVGKTLVNVYQFDASTNHGSQMARKKFPKENLKEVTKPEWGEICQDPNWCWMVFVSFKTYKLKKNVPSIDLRRTRAQYNRERKRWQMVLLNPDTTWIFSMFEFVDFKFERFFVAPADYLPENILSMIKTAYNTKEEAKVKFKGTILESLAKFETENFYGQSIKAAEYHYTFIFNEEINDFAKKFKVDDFPTIQNRIKKHILPFQVGMWTLAYSNADLINLVFQVGIDKAVYCDTDCIKFVGEEGIEIIKEHNAKIDKEFENVKMERQIDFGPKLGRWKDEGVAKRFKAIAPKWYLEEVNDELIVKAAGAKTAVLKSYLDNSNYPFEEFNLKLSIPNLFASVKPNKELGIIEKKDYENVGSYIEEVKINEQED